VYVYRRWPTIGRPNCRTIDRLISFGDTYAIICNITCVCMCVRRYRGVSLLYYILHRVILLRESLLLFVYYCFLRFERKTSDFFYRFRSDVRRIPSYFLSSHLAHAQISRDRMTCRRRGLLSRLFTSAPFSLSESSSMSPAHHHHQHRSVKHIALSVTV